MEEMLIDALRKAPNKDIQALLLQTYIQEYGPLSDANGEVVRQILREGVNKVKGVSILRAEQIFDKMYLDREHPSDFIDYISHAVERELVSKFIDQLEDHKPRVVVLKEPEFIEDLPGSWWHQSAYRQSLECMEVVQCKNCRMNFPWCRRFRAELGGNGFCPYGAKIVNDVKEIEDE